MSTAFTVSHVFGYIVPSPAINSKNSLISFIISSLTKLLLTVSALQDLLHSLSPVWETLFPLPTLPQPQGYRMGVLGPPQVGLPLVHTHQLGQRLGCSPRAEWKASSCPPMSACPEHRQNSGGMWILPPPLHQGPFLVPTLSLGPLVILAKGLSILLVFSKETLEDWLILLNFFLFPLS